MVHVYAKHGLPLFALVIWCMCWCTGPLAAQQPPPHLVQAAVNGIEEVERARQARSLVSAMPGVLMARFDRHTMNMMLHVTPEADIDAEAINAVLMPHGMSIRCYIRQVAGVVPFVHVDVDRCSDQAPVAR